MCTKQKLVQRIFYAPIQHPRLLAATSRHRSVPDFVLAKSWQSNDVTRKAAEERKKEAKKCMAAFANDAKTIWPLFPSLALALVCWLSYCPAPAIGDSPQYDKINDTYG